MTQSTVTTQLTQSFSNTSPGAPVSLCCKNVKGEWAEYPKVVINDPKNNIKYLGPGGVHQTYYLDTIPKGVKATVRLRVTGRIKGTLVCKCMDDGRTLSKTQVDEPFTTDVEMPIASYNYAKALVPGIGWAVAAYQVGKVAKQAYDIYNANPELVKEVMKQSGPAGKKAVEKIANSADELCKNKHKCAESPPAPSAPPAPGKPGPSDTGPLVS